MSKIMVQTRDIRYARHLLERECKKICPYFTKVGKGKLIKKGKKKNHNLYEFEVK